ncbi:MULTISPECIES: hypothetical protein [Serratia]|jgi:hypothetical protein|uniref:Uncharacterized protein n=1 Tax=Serratia marcescens TaxID=615 RepID=A0ABD6HM17_SERMA|nr:hypothetical protein [Serratia marcescens]MBH2771443.1 hypothetical protein [Serratia marcescens]MBH3058468.1 hypothetical protein [Serratia marcescens]MDF9720007.1 hypothetical protein [Serratia marcescens]MDV5742775.1 hypothetical protein [Serratia marcescens]MDV5747686.1 hypothetical protein [Serratia marcescens]
MTVLRQFVERLHILERNNIGRPGERGGNYGANAATRWGGSMLIIRLYGSPIVIGEEEEPHDDAPDDAEDVAAAGSFAA